jgi:low affinity Fe/Cu permease
MDNSTPTLGYSEFGDIIKDWKFAVKPDGLATKVTISEAVVRDIEKSFWYLKDVLGTRINGREYMPDELLRFEGEECELLLPYNGLKDLGINIYESWSSFLTVLNHRVCPPSSFFIIEDSSFLDEAGNPNGGLVDHYLSVCDFMQLLIGASDHAERLDEVSVRSLVFLFKNRLEIPVEYGTEVLGDKLDGFSILRDLFDENSHIEQKRNILKEVLNQQCLPIHEADRLTHILNNFGLFSARVVENYHLFVTDFSFEDVRKEYEEKRRDYLLKIDEIFSSVYTKLMGIPVSLGILAVRMGGLKNFTPAADFFLMLAIAVYALMMVALVQNQRHSLVALKQEFKGQIDRFRLVYTLKNDKIDEIESELRERSRFQERCLTAFFWISVLLLFFVVGLYCKQVFPEYWEIAIERAKELLDSLKVLVASSSSAT